MSLDALADRLKSLHDRLDDHYRQLSENRGSLKGQPPIFALEHSLAELEVDDLKKAVRTAIADRFQSKYWKNSWLPFVVYATEIGYEYVGDEYWSTFQGETPGWLEHGDRGRIRDWFKRFAESYGGAIPEGAFARNFTIISWPITHAVLPIYLQRNLARLLFDYRAGITAALLREPDALGASLAAHASGYTERFRLFTENTSLLGHIAVSLLQGEDEESPYLLKSTLLRLVEGLEQEREAKEWLRGARRAASNARTRGFLPTDQSIGGASSRIRLLKPTDPKLVIRLSETGWRLYAQLPNLTSLASRLPSVYSELQARRARIEGAENHLIARGGLARLGPEVRLTSWPDPNKPFIQLEDGDDRANQILQEQSMITRGPIWLFRKRGPGFAVEIRGRHVRPGGTYYIAHSGAWEAPGYEWAKIVKTEVAGATLVRLRLPQTLSAEETGALVESGISVASKVTIQPVGFPIRAWDGEGTAEWLAGEPVLIGICVEEAPSSLLLEVAGRLRELLWPDAEQFLFLSLDDLPAGAHRLRVELRNEQKQPLTQGEFSIEVRDPSSSIAEAGVGEGIRILTAPPSPTMRELWEPGAVTIAGPIGLTANLRVRFRDERYVEFESVSRNVVLPVGESEWVDVAESLRKAKDFSRAYEEAESVVLTVSHSGVEFSPVVADRGFQPLRWKLRTRQKGSFIRLIDRTDRGDTKLELFSVETPLNPTPLPLQDELPVPAAGGLLRARVGEESEVNATVVLPVSEFDVLLSGSNAQPDVQIGPRTTVEFTRLIDGYRLWATAESPGHPFSEYQRDAVLTAIGRAFYKSVAGSKWSAIEERVGQDGHVGMVREMQAAVGDSAEAVIAANAIATTAPTWNGSSRRLTGFAEAMRRGLTSQGFEAIERVAGRLLALAQNPGSLLDWPTDEQDKILRAVLDKPYLLRASRFALLLSGLSTENHERVGR